MKNLLPCLLSVFSILFVSQGCKKADKPVGCIQSSLTTGQVSQSIVFTSCSTGGDSYLWDFGDGETASTAQATYSYSAPGTYTVTLTVTNAGGSTQSTTAITITGAAGVPFACIQASALSIHVGDTLTFSSCSNNATEYVWNFGDSTTATMQVVQHVFNGPATVTLTARNAIGFDTATVDIRLIPPTRNDFLGAYSGIEPCISSVQYDCNISATPGFPESIIFSGLSGGNLDVTGIINGYDIVIPRQTLGGVLTSGTGTISLDFKVISYTLERSYSGDTWYCTGTLTLK